MERFENIQIILDNLILLISNHINSSEPSVLTESFSNKKSN
jgi:hypothetical protein